MKKMTYTCDVCGNEFEPINSLSGHPQAEKHYANVQAQMGIGMESAHWQLDVCGKECKQRVKDAVIKAMEGLGTEKFA